MAEALSTRDFLGGSEVNNPPAMQEMQEMLVPSLGQGDTPEKGMAAHSSILAWRIPWTEQPGGLPSLELERVRHSWAINTVYSVEDCQAHLVWVGFTRNRLGGVMWSNMLIRDQHLWKEDGWDWVEKETKHHVVSTNSQPEWWEALQWILPIRVACIQLSHPSLLQSLAPSCFVKSISFVPGADSDVTDSWWLPADSVFFFFFSLFFLFFCSDREKTFSFFPPHSRDIFAYCFVVMQNFITFVPLCTLGRIADCLFSTKRKMKNLSHSKCTKKLKSELERLFFLVFVYE